MDPVLAAMPLWVLQHVPALVFMFCFGACVGSFINVVIYRLPAGMSVISPPSRCPTCGARLRFFRENLPILGWFLVRGRCRHCGERVSAQYMVIELLMALAFLGLYVVFYMTRSSMPWWGEVGGPWWVGNAVFRTWPVFVVVAFMFAGLIAMTVIDAKTFTIPIQIPLFITVAAFIAFPLQALLPLRPTSGHNWPIQVTNWQWTLTAVLGMAGIVIGVVLLKLRILRYSFHDYDKYVADGEVLGDYPHARREMGVELLFLLPCLIGVTAGCFLGGLLPESAPPRLLQAIGGTFIGYLTGGGIVWFMRITGTWAFGREAMGMGDVHLLAAVGAVLGWVDPLLIFFIAPFSGLAWAVLSKCLSSVFRMIHRQLPFGPHLALAAVAVILCRPGITYLWNLWMPFPLPSPGFLP